MTQKNQEADLNIQQQVTNALDAALARAEINFLASNLRAYTISSSLSDALKEISNLSQKASTGFTNIVTCLAIKVAMPGVDIRYHQVQIQDKTDRPARFNFRGISEKTVYPWLSEHTFEGAKSGWQTRTFERPKPYMLTYDENIGDIKDSFYSGPCFQDSSLSRALS